MWKFILISIMSIGLSSDIKNINLEKHHWVDYANIVTENGTEFRVKKLSIKNDSVYSFLHLTKETRSFPLKIKDSLFIFKRSEHLSHGYYTYPDDTTYLDTMIYEFKYVQNIPTLILQSPDKSRVQILYSLNDTSPIIETNNLVFPQVEYFNFKIGDTLYKNKYEELDLRYSSLYYNDTQYKILLEKPQNTYCYINEEGIIIEIMLTKIAKSKINTLKNHFTNKLGFKPKIIYSESNSKDASGYKWDNNFIYIKLYKTDSKNKPGASWRLDYTNKLTLNVLNEKNLIH